MKTSSYNKFSRVIQQIQTLKERLNPEINTKKKVITPIKPYPHFVKITSELKNLKKQVIDRRKRETQELIDRNRSLLQFSTFELMEHDFKENTHSNVLRYLFDWRFNNEIGSQLLCRFIESIDSDDVKTFSSLIRKNKYTVEREISFGKGRMDLLIRDTVNKFVIVIENKIYASVDVRDEVDEKENQITQLTDYRDYVESTYKTYKKLYILLSHTPIDDNEKHKPFIFTNYKNLYKVLQTEKVNDAIVYQYTMLIHSLAHNITNKQKLNEQANLLKTNKNVGLNTLEQINGVLYERN
jgi:hypothetical protein